MITLLKKGSPHSVCTQIKGICCICAFPLLAYISKLQELKFYSSEL
jgi:hypothetical protein